MLPSARARDQLRILVAGGPKLAEKKGKKKGKKLADQVLDLLIVATRGHTLDE